MTSLSDINQTMPAAFVSQAEVQNQSMVQGTVAAQHNVDEAKAAEEQVETAEETQNPQVRPEQGRREQGRRAHRHPRRRRRRPDEVLPDVPNPDGQGNIIDVTA